MAKKYCNGVPLVNARTCNGCRASKHYVFKHECEMGYGFNCTYKGVPVRPCPKPKTNDAWIAARDKIFAGEERP